MEKQQFKEEILFKVSGGVLEIELDDTALDKVLDAALREVQRYIDTTKIITIPYSKCIDFTGCKVSSVVRVRRSQGFTNNESIYSNGTAITDPMYVSQWQLVSGTGTLYNFSDYVLNYAAWNTLLQIRNTTSTDLAFIYDKSSEKLYINISAGIPDTITVEFIPKLEDVSEIVSDYWIDVTMRLAVALTKITLGRIRTMFTQSNALWGLDGNTILEEGKSELQELRTQLTASTQLVYPID